MMSRITRILVGALATAIVTATASLAFAAPAQAAPPGYSVHGIDVSVYQGTINWSSVAGAGNDFAYARASLGSGYTDPTFNANHDGAKSNGLYFGAYHFARPDQSGGRQQADFFLDRARVRDDGKTLPPMLDMEWGPDSVPTCFGLSQSEMASWVGQFVDRVKARTGRVATIYTNRNWWDQCVGTAADYGNHPLSHPCYCASPGTLAKGWSRFTFWQYTSTGSVAGVSGNVDQDVFNGSLADLKALATQRPVTDFSGDGNADVLARNAADTDLYLFKGDGSGGFDGGGVNIGNNWSAFDVLLSPGDFSGDGKADVLARNATDTDLYLFKGDGVGGFSGSAVNIGNNWSGFDAIFSPGDFTGDGNADVLARNAANHDLYLFKGDGSGGFAAGTGTVVGNNWSAFDVLLSPGDFSGDGNPDVLARNATDADLYLFKGDGSGGFSGSAVNIGNNWSGFNAILSVGDFSGDGNADVLARNATDADLYLFKGDGAGGFSGSGVAVGNNWSGFDRIF